MAELGRVPVAGDTVELPGWSITVLAMDGMRVDRLRFVPVGGADGLHEKASAEGEES